MEFKVKIQKPPRGRTGIFFGLNATNTLLGSIGIGIFILLVMLGVGINYWIAIFITVFWLLAWVLLALWLVCKKRSIIKRMTYLLTEEGREAWWVDHPWSKEKLSPSKNQVGLLQLKMFPFFLGKKMNARYVCPVDFLSGRNIEVNLLCVKEQMKLAGAGQYGKRYIECIKLHSEKKEYESKKFLRGGNAEFEIEFAIPSGGEKNTMLIKNPPTYWELEVADSGSGLTLSTFLLPVYTEGIREISSAYIKNAAKNEALVFSHVEYLWSQ